ncbi:hypothetical protein TNCV_967891 [Trichonephila clavipes]|nr:hypothetical protein TNCV_967891 [Trichonephila clavipes]
MQLESPFEVKPNKQFRLVHSSTNHDFKAVICVVREQSPFIHKRFLIDHIDTSQCPQRPRLATVNETETGAPAGN